MKTVVVAAALAAGTAAAQAGDTWPTPEIAEIDQLEIPHAIAYAMKGMGGDSGVTVGLAVVCAIQGPRRV